MIRVVVADQHPSTCAGVNAILHEHAGVVPVGVAADRRALWPLLYRTDPDVVVLDDLRLCLAVRARQPKARVVLHGDASAGGLASLDGLAPGARPSGAGLWGAVIVAAAFAGASALVDKRCGPAQLVAAIRGENALPVITPRLQRHAAAKLDPTERAILAMRLAGTPDREIAATVDIDPRALGARNARIVAVLSGRAVAALDRAGKLHAG
jgi:DNA-binding NarL/FixJ family response regulator